MRTPRWAVACCCAWMLAGGVAFELLLPGAHRRPPRRGFERCEQWRGPAAAIAPARAAPVARYAGREDASAEEEGIGERLQDWLRRFIPALAFFLFVRTWVLEPCPRAAHVYYKHARPMMVRPCATGGRAVLHPVNIHVSNPLGQRPDRRREVLPAMELTTAR